MLGPGGREFVRPEDATSNLAALRSSDPAGVRELNPALVRRLDDWDRIRRWFDRLLEFQERRGFVGGCPIGALATERAETDDPLRPHLVEAFRRKGEALREGLETMKRKGSLRKDADPGRLADFVTAVLQGALLMASVRKERGPLEAALDEAYGHLRSFAAD